MNVIIIHIDLLILQHSVDQLQQTSLNPRANKISIGSLALKSKSFQFSDRRLKFVSSNPIPKKTYKNVGRSKNWCCTSRSTNRRRSQRPKAIIRGKNLIASNIFVVLFRSSSYSVLHSASFDRYFETKIKINNHKSKSIKIALKSCKSHLIM